MTAVSYLCVLKCDYCSDVDECADGTANCSADATCTNTDPGFNCTCNPGYHGDGVTCTGKPVLVCIRYAFLALSVVQQLFTCCEINRVSTALAPREGFGRLNLPSSVIKTQEKARASGEKFANS